MQKIELIERLIESIEKLKELIEDNI